MPRHPPRASSSMADDKQHSLREWGALSSQVLKLKCNQYNLVSTGNKQTMQKRLFEFFNPQEAPTPSSTGNDITPSSTGNDTILEVLHELKRLRTEVADIRDTQNNRNALFQLPTAENVTPPFPLPIVESPLFSESVPANSNIPNIPCTLNTEPIRPAVNNANMNILQGTNLLFTSNHNPFTPPPIKSSVLKKIGKEEYVEFDEILPAPPAISITDNFFGLEMDADSSSLILKESKPKVKIWEFSTWICAWNLFIQAYLSIKPDMHYPLACYQKIFCNLVRKFKFENCYAYDKAFRTQIAAEINTPPTHRTTSWERQNDDLYNLYLRDAYLPACYHCSSYGHYIATCPFKSAKRIHATSTIATSTAIASNSSQHGFRNFPQKNNQYSYTANDTPDRSAPTPSHSSNGTSNGTCARFNRGAYCKKPPCMFIHKCNRCNRANHNGTQCFLNTSTPFRPQSF